MSSEGLSSAEALALLAEECGEVVRKWEENEKSNISGSDATSNGFLSATPDFYHAGLIISAIFIAIGAVDMDNEISFPLLFMSLFILLFSTFSWIIFWRIRKRRKDFKLRKVNDFIKYLQRTNPNFGYYTLPEPLTDDMWGQLCLRNGQAVNVPKILLVTGDHLLLRPGQIIPCSCLTTTGTYLTRGHRLDMKTETDPKTGASEKLQPMPAIACESLITSHILEYLSSSYKQSSLEKQVEFVLNDVIKKYLFLPYLIVVLLVVIVRYYHATSESFYGTRFVFSIPALILLPLLVPLAFYILYFLQRWNNNSVSDSLGVACEPSQKELVDVFGRLTGMAILDKKGVLSPTNPCIDKVIVFRQANDGQLIPETLGLSSEMNPDDKWKLYFDDPAWKESMPNLRPLGLNLQLNSCRHNHSFVSFLDHLSVVSAHVPRTIVAAQRRCMCQFPPLLGFDQESCAQFLEKTPQQIGFYKRQPGDAPLPGLTKHRTPLEMAFCCIHKDAKSLHSHVTCQGTADLVLDACTHVWDGERLVPLTSRLTRVVRDIYQRNSMTGYCLVISYRATGSSLSDELQDKFVEVPLARENNNEPQIGIRCQSSENILEEQFFSDQRLSTAEEVIDGLFTGHVLCGLVVMQYEALPTAVQLVEGLENNCVRFVYFSRENELRSRVFAEKLGLEAGWNCHISLAEAAEDKDSDRTYSKVLLSNGETDWKIPLIKGKRQAWLSRSEAYLNRTSEESFRNSPFRRQSSVTSLKVGAMPNKARLPTGVSQVRPHLDEVDNVPLLVGLFTDCDPRVNEEMLSIMDENDEVVLAVGSSMNTANTRIFVHNELCVSVPPIADKNCEMATANEGGLMASDLASRIMALVTDFELSHRQLLNLPETVLACRHRLWSVKASLSFIFLGSLQLSLLLSISALAFLPLVFTTSQVLLTVFIQLPILFVGTVWTPFQTKNTVIRIAPKKPIQNTTTIFLMSFVLQFLPSILVLLATFFFSLADNATMLCSFSDVACSFEDDLKLSTQEIRHVVGLHFCVYLCVNSAAWIHPLSLGWQDNPLRSIPWIGSFLATLGLQVAHSYLSGVYLHRALSLPSSLVMFFWSCLLFIGNEICKSRSIRAFLREQRRTKLAFDTKLGMNSPY